MTDKHDFKAAQKYAALLLLIESATTNGYGLDFWHDGDDYMLSIRNIESDIEEPYDWCFREASFDALVEQATQIKEVISED